MTPGVINTNGQETIIYCYIRQNHRQCYPLPATRYPLDAPEPERSAKNSYHAQYDNSTAIRKLVWSILVMLAFINPIQGQSFINDLIDAVLGCPPFAPPDGVEGIPANNWNLCPNQDWRLVFHDEFNGDMINSEKWLTYYPFTADGSDQAMITRTSEDAMGVNLDENVFQENGMLKIRVKNEQVNWFGQTKKFSTGVIYSRGNWKFYKGRFEIRCKIPYASGAPLLWPAFWMHGGIPGMTNSESEIDVFEFCGHQPAVIKTDMHRFYEGGGSRYDCHSAASISGAQGYHSSFHVFAVEWDHYYLRWYVDGQLIRSDCSLITLGGQSVSGCNVAQGTFGRNPKFPRAGAQLNVIANCAVARSGQNEFCGSQNQSSSAFPVDFEIDWIRVYQREGQAHHPALYTSSDQLNIHTTHQTLCQNQEATVTLSGPAGNIQWTLGPHLERVSATGNSITIRATAGASSGSWVTASSTGAPLSSGNGTRSITIQVGAPVASYSSVTVAPCGNIIEMTCYTGPNDMNVNHEYYINNQQLSESCITLGNYYPILPWHHQAWYCTGENPGDFCMPREMRVSNACGSDSRQGIIADNCVYGPCNVIDPVDVDELVALITNYPNPSTDFTLISIDERIDLSIIKEIEVLRAADASSRWKLSKVNERLISIPTLNWESGIYYVLITMSNDAARTKLQFKL